MRAFMCVCEFCGVERLVEDPAGELTPEREEDGSVNPALAASCLCLHIALKAAYSGG